MNSIIKADEIVSDLDPRTGKCVPPYDSLNTISLTQKMLEYAEWLGMVITSTFCGDTFTSVSGKVDGYITTITQYKEAN